MKLKSYLTLFLITLSASPTLYGEETQERGAPGSRPIPLEIRMELEKDKEDEQKYAKAIEEEDEDKISKGQGALFPRDFSGSHHWVAGRTFDGFFLDTEDGAQWKVYPEDGITSANWLMSDDIVLVTNGDKIKNNYPYKLKNLDRKNEVRVNLSWGPYIRGLYSFEIVDIDFNKNNILIMDGAGFTTFIDLSRWDTKVTKYWMVGDQIIVGVNNDWLRWWNPYFFLNVETLTHARGSL